MTEKTTDLEDENPETDLVDDGLTAEPEPEVIDPADVDEDDEDDEGTVLDENQVHPDATYDVPVQDPDPEPGS